MCYLFNVIRKCQCIQFLSSEFPRRLHKLDFYVLSSKNTILRTESSSSCNNTFRWVYAGGFNVIIDVCCPF